MTIPSTTVMAIEIGIEKLSAPARRQDEHAQHLFGRVGRGRQGVRREDGKRDLLREPLVLEAGRALRPPDEQRLEELPLVCAIDAAAYPAAQVGYGRAMQIILLIRHGLAEYKPGHLYGWTPGVHLSAEGREEAKRLAERLEDREVHRRRIRLRSSAR